MNIKEKIQRIKSGAITRIGEHDVEFSKNYRGDTWYLQSIGNGNNDRIITQFGISLKQFTKLVTKTNNDYGGIFPEMPMKYIDRALLVLLSLSGEKN